MKPAYIALAPTLVMVLALSLPATAAPPAEPFPASTHVIAVPDLSHVVVAHGSKDRFPATAKNLVVSPRGLPRPDRKNPPVDFGVVIAFADVERVDAHTALLRLHDVKQSPKVGDHVTWSLTLPKGQERLRDSALFWAAALDIGAQSLELDQDLFVLRDFFADPAASSRILGAMVKEIRRNADLARAVYPDPVDSGAYRGQTLATIFATAGERDLAAFWDYVVSEPWNYTTYSFRLVDIFATWIVRGAPQAPEVKTQRQLVTLKIELGQMLRRQAWEAAEKRLIEVLRRVPGDVTLQTELELVGTIRRANAALVRDPVDDAAAWLRARALAEIGLYPAAIMAFEQLIARDYRVAEAREQLGHSLCGASRWTECERLFDDLIRARGKLREPDPDLEKWRAYAHTRGTQGGTESGADSASHIATARVLEDEGGWANAVGSWRNALTLAREAGDVATQRQAEAGLARATKRLALAEEVDGAVTATREHRIEVALSALTAIRKAALEMGEPEAGSLALESLARAAADVGERDFARVVLEARVADVAPMCSGTACKARGAALADLAERVAEDENVQAAEAMFSEAVKLAPDDVSVRAARAWFFAELGRWSDAYSAAFMGAGKSLSMTYTMVRSTAARARFDERDGEALEYADRLGRKAPRFGLVAAAVHRLANAQKALAEVGPNGSEATARVLLRRIRALVAVGLERIAMAELPGLTAFTALHREAAWAIASPPSTRPAGADLFPPADRLQAAEIAAQVPTPERRRRLERLTRQRDLQRALDLPAALGKASAIADASLALARAALAEGDFDRAWALARDNGGKAALELVKNAREGVRAELLMTHALEARDRGDAKPQRLLAEEARLILKPVGAPARVLDAALLACEALVTLGLEKDANGPAREGLQAAQQDGNPERIRAFEALLARLGPRDEKAASAPPRSRLDVYEDTLHEHLRQCDALDDDRCLARTDEELGLVAIQRGRVTEARTALDAAVAGYAGQHDRARARRATMAIARVLRLRSELALAAAKAEEVLSAAVIDGDGEAEREALLELGSLALAQGDLGASRKWLGAAREAAVRGNDDLSVARADANLGRAELLLAGDLSLATRLLEAAFARFERHGASGDALGARIDLAESLLQSSTSAARPAPNDRRKIDRPRARKIAERALALVIDAPALAASLGRDVLHVRALLALATARLATSNPSAASAVLVEASRFGAHIELDELNARTGHLEARVAAALGQREDAARLALAAAQRLARPLAAGTLPLGLGETLAVFQQAADLLFELGRHEEALELLELQRTATLARSFDLERLRQTAHPALAAELAVYADARARADAVQARLREDADAPAPDTRARNELIMLAAASQAELVPLAQRLEQEHPAHWKALARDPTSLATDRRKLPKGTILVEYFVTGDALYLFVVRPGRAPSPTAQTPTTLGPITALRVAIDAVELSDTIARYRKLLATDARLAEPLGRELYAWLLAPVARLVPDAERSAATVILLPHGPLFEVPFAALVASTVAAPVRYALQDWRLAVASATTLAPLLAGPRKLAVLGPVLGLADPDGSLPEARKELDRLPAILRATILRGADATEERLLTLSSDHRILHFATHGTLAHNPLDSSLLLASGRLTVGRIAGLDGLRGKIALVFLSACQSASDNDTGDPEAMSLAEGFALAGVPTLIASLWDVDDRATRFLVEAFYNGLAAGSGDTLGALRAAQLAMLEIAIDGQKPFVDPRFWSAFQLIGDFR